MKVLLSFLFALNGSFGLTKKATKMQNAEFVKNTSVDVGVEPQIHLRLEVHPIMSPSRNLDEVVCMAVALDFFGVPLANHPYDELLDLILEPGQTPGSVLNNIINVEGNPEMWPANYFTADLSPNFGLFYGEIELFEQYMINSLEHHHPALIQAWGNNSPFPETSYLIVGIDNEHNEGTAWLSMYYCMDPETGQIIAMLGGDLVALGEHHISLTGYDVFSPTIPKSLDYVVQNDEHDVDQLLGMKVKEVERFDEDLDHALRVHEIGDLHNAISFIGLPHFVGELYAFNYREPIAPNDFRISTDILPTSNPNSWTSDVIELKHVAEDSGYAHREASIYAQISFTHEPSTNHLIFTLIIFVAGDAWRTPLDGHVWFKTGSLLSFTRR